MKSHTKTAIRMFIGGIIFLTVFVVFHELTHIFFLDNYGCDWYLTVDADAIRINAYDSCRQSLTDAEWNRLVIAQDMVEAVGYQLQPLVVLWGVYIGKKW